LLQLFLFAFQFASVFLPGFAFKYRKGKSFLEKLLKGKSIRTNATINTRLFWFNLVYCRAEYRTPGRLVFRFVGFLPVNFTTISNARKSTLAERQKWNERIRKMGQQLK
jgi:NAD(P)H dehydrogenase (quinone)